jgi:hypothetical protein
LKGAWRTLAARRGSAKAIIKRWHQELLQTLDVGPYAPHQFKQHIKKTKGTMP